ncbi:FAD-binding oxidoreductase [Kitasatospora sp. NBC_01287]|uniref:FAD-dependent oxidoreductase n=1 Tax=Kitasatospora sp. NBC_01287 TaxID=2903573 RepID=UPI00224C9D7C|nr:FAD-dependent oxidoreductase [Kitasatospora sp. NBC_01287]MCX4749979.1 FAD-binding oxidoreductase [Kitasatospora sp. NBC_01287]
MPARQATGAAPGPPPHPGPGPAPHPASAPRSVPAPGRAPGRGVGRDRVAIVGGGLAGAALAWRLVRRGCPVTVFTGGRESAAADATEASGGLVRGFEPDLVAARSAATGLAELRADPVLRDWAGYRETGSCFVLLPGSGPGPGPGPGPGGDRPPGPDAVLGLLDGLLPGSAELVEAASLPAFRSLPPGTWAVLERAAGRISPARLRRSLLTAVERHGGRLCAEPVADPSDAELRSRHRAVVLATGPWTPALLARAGLPDQGLRSKQIQYTVLRGVRLPPGLGSFVDETSGLYGRPDGPDGLLLGLPTDRWDVDPVAPRPDPALAVRVLAVAQQRLRLPPGPGGRRHPGHARTVAATDCYALSGGLMLRQLVGQERLFTFTGGTGGAAKTALTAARTAAEELLQAAAAG